MKCKCLEWTRGHPPSTHTGAGGELRCDVCLMPTQGTEAGTAKTVQQGLVHDGPVGVADAPNPSPMTSETQALLERHLETAVKGFEAAIVELNRNADTIDSLEASLANVTRERDAYRETIGELWHLVPGDGPSLEHYLGMTWDEYAAWANAAVLYDRTVSKTVTVALNDQGEG